MAEGGYCDLWVEDSKTSHIGGWGGNERTFRGGVRKRHSNTTKFRLWPFPSNLTHAESWEKPQIRSA